VAEGAPHALHDTAPAIAGVVEGGADADLTLPSSLAAVSAVVTGLEPPKKKPLRITVPADVSKQTPRALVGIWSKLSKGLAGNAVQQVRLVLPPDGRLLTVPGLFGCPREAGDEGDDHWLIEGSPEPKEKMLEIVLVRRGRRNEDRRRAVVRHEGCHVTAHTRWVGSRCQGVVRGLVNRPSGSKVAVNRRGTNKLPNATAALADALAEWLEGYREKVPVTVWLADDLIRAAIRGNYTDKNRTKYRGVRPPDMDRALVRLQRAVKEVKVGVKLKKAKRAGAMSREIIGAAAAVEKVKSLADELTVSLSSN